MILVPVAGALGVAWMITRFAPEAKGHGVPEVMDAIYYAGEKIRPVLALPKSIMSSSPQSEKTTAAETGKPIRESV